MSLFSWRKSPAAPHLEVQRFRSKAEFDSFHRDHARQISAEFEAECDLVKSPDKDFFVEGFCYVCARRVRFHVGFSIKNEIHGRIVPGWRATVGCPRCDLANRQRAAIHLLEQEGPFESGESIYLSEMLSQLYKVMARRHSNVQGSEFLGTTVERGKLNKQGIRNEDLTHLTFASGVFDAAMCFDVLEHVPNYKAALNELSRVIKRGGKLLMSAPFNPAIQEHSIRARHREDGSIEHLLEPEYHSDILDPNGCLCYYHFGWEMLNDLREAGFGDAYVVRYASREYGYLGPDPLMFIAIKG